MQSLIMTQAAVSHGKTQIIEKVFENRLVNNAKALNKMGGNVTVYGDTAIVTGGKLHGDTVSATDLRGGAGLVLAALAAEGTTTIDSVHHIERGYCSLVQSLNAVGADIVIIE
jgi:UDP-N-acetylglucosamine 1-carboxyvinyltransferase